MSNKNKFLGWVIGLIISMLVLVLAVIGWVIIDGFLNRSYHRELMGKLEQVQYVAVDSLGIASIPEGTYMTANDVKTLLTDKLVDQSTIIDSNNYLAIILTLITLCVSLSVVIPYIVGKSISEKDIKDVVEELYMKNKADESVKYKMNVNMLLASEAHFSRMTAYQLLCSSTQKYSELNVPEYQGNVNPIWSAGWAAKSLIRYITANNPSYKKLCAESVKYVIDAINALQPIDSYIELIRENKGVAERAFIDLFNALVYKETLGSTILGSTDELKAALNKLYQILKKVNSTILQDIKTESLKKSHRELYLDSTDLVEDFAIKADNLIKEL